MKHILLLFLFLLLSSCAPASTGSSATVQLTGDATPTLSVPANTSDTAIVTSGIVVPVEDAALSFGAAGHIREISVEVGDVVRAGDVLAVLDNTAVQAELSGAERALKELQSPAAIAAVELRLAKARNAVKDAQTKVEGLRYPRASDVQMDNVEAEIDLAEEALARAQEAYKRVARLQDGEPKKAAAVYAMTEAQIRLNKLIAEYNWYTGKPNDIDSAIAHANLDSASAAVQELEWYLAALQGQAVPAQATGADLATLESAKISVMLAEQRLAATRLVAPIAGQVVALDFNAGEYVQPGQMVLILSNVQQLQVRTTDLGEMNVAQVQVGQPVIVYIEALDQKLSGHVLLISPVAKSLDGDVVYETIISLGKPYPNGLRAGMSVEVHFTQE